MHYKKLFRNLILSNSISLIVITLVFGIGSHWINFAMTTMIYSSLYTVTYIVVEQLYFGMNRAKYIMISISCAMVMTLLGQLITIGFSLVPFSGFVLLELIIVAVLILPTYKAYKLYRKVIL